MIITNKDEKHNPKDQQQKAEQQEQEQHEMSIDSGSPDLERQN